MSRYINKLIFKRFFFRKNQDGSTDYTLPFFFMLVVLVFSSLIFIQSLGLYQLNKDKEEYLSEDWNKFYDIYTADKMDGFDEYKNSLEESGAMDFYSVEPGFPTVISVKSKTKEIFRLPTYKLNTSSDTLLINLVTNNKPLDKHSIYLQRQLMETLDVEDGDIVLIRESSSSKGTKKGYDFALKVHPIEGITKLKSFIFQDYVDGKFNGEQTNKIVRYEFLDIDNLFEFLLNDLSADNFPTPYYIGYGDDGTERSNNLMIYSSVEDDNARKYGRKKIHPYLKDQMLLSNYLYYAKKDSIAHKADIKHQKDNIILSDSLRLVVSGCEQRKEIIIPLAKEDINGRLDSEDQAIYKNTLAIDKNEIHKELRELCECEKSDECWKDNFKVLSTSFLDKNSNIPSKFYIQYDFSRNINHYTEKDDRSELQEKIFEHFGSIDGMEFWHDEQKVRKGRNSKTIFSYYHDFSDKNQNLEILNRLDELNVRWDNARWNKMIEYQENIEKSTRNIWSLIIINLIAFILVLVIKFMLRLKLELHLLGVIKCFGYSKRIIQSTYNIGNLLIIIIGFLLGYLPFGILLGWFSGYSFATILGIYFSSEILYGVYFLMMLVLCSIATTTIFINMYTEKENIYELIKYES